MNLMWWLPSVTTSPSHPCLLHLLYCMLSCVHLVLIHRDCESDRVTPLANSVGISKILLNFHPRLLIIIWNSLLVCVRETKSRWIKTWKQGSSFCLFSPKMLPSPSSSSPSQSSTAEERYVIYVYFSDRHLSHVMIMSWVSLLIL